MGWPVEVGGGGKTMIEQMIFNEVSAYLRAPHAGPGVHFGGPARILHGNEDQKCLHPPAIANHDVMWCQRFPKSQTGSDLASLQTRAVEDGVKVVVSGSTIRASFGHDADWCWLAVQTNLDAPRHRGISLLMVDKGVSERTVRHDAIETTRPDGRPIAADVTLAVQLAVEIAGARLSASSRVSGRSLGGMPKNDGKLSKVWNADLGGRQHDVGLPVMCPAVPVLQLATGGRGGPKSPR